MKQRSKILTALFLSASLAVTPAASVSVLAEDLDFAAVEEIDVVPEEEISDSEEVSTSTEDSVLAADITTEDSDLTTDEFTADTSTFSTDEADVFTSGETSEQDVSEARTHSIKVSVINSSGVASGMYAMDSAVVTRQDDGTYLVRMHQTSVNRNYMALTDDKNKATNHEVDWYVAGGDDGYWYTIPVASLTDPLYASFSYTKNVNAGKAWGNVQTITFDVSSMAETEERDAVASDINKLPATNGPADYTSVDAALATVPEDLSIYTDETADAVRAAVAAVKRDYTMAQQADVDKMAQAITDAVNALVKKAVEEAKTHSIKVSVTNSEGVASGMYAMDDAIVTKQDDPKVEEAAIEMVKFFTSAEAQQTAMEMQGMVPASNTVELTDTAKDKYPLLAEFLDLATTEGEKRSDTLQATMYSNLLDVMSQQLPLLASGELDAKGFCQTLTDAAAKNQ